MDTVRTARRPRRRVATLLAGAALVAASLTTAATPAQAADETVGVDFSVAGGRADLPGVRAGSTA